MAVLSPFSRILLSACPDSRLLCSVVFEMSNSESISERFPECLFPRISSDLFSNFRCERDSFRNYDHIIYTHKPAHTYAVWTRPLYWRRPQAAPTRK